MNISRHFGSHENVALPASDVIASRLADTGRSHEDIRASSGKKVGHGEGVSGTQREADPAPRVPAPAASEPTSVDVVLPQLAEKQPKTEESPTPHPLRVSQSSE